MAIISVDVPTKYWHDGNTLDTLDNLLEKVLFEFLTDDLDNITVRMVSVPDTSKHLLVRCEMQDKRLLKVEVRNDVASLVAKAASAVLKKSVVCFVKIIDKKKTSICIRATGRQDEVTE